MCNIWEKDRKPEISLEQLERAFSDNLFRKIQNVNVTGGEPTLQKDLSQIVQLLINKMPELRKITLTSNGLNPDRIVTSSAEISEICSESDIDFLVGISLDGVGEVHDEIRNVPRAFERTSETILRIQELQQLHRNKMRLSVNCTITRKNLHDLENVIDWGNRHSIYVNFIVAEFSENFYSNKNAEEQLRIKGKDKAYLIRFLERLAGEKSLFNFAAYFHNVMLEMMKNSKARTAPCIYGLDGFVFDIYGDLYYCILWDKIGNCLEENCSSIYYDPRNIGHRRNLLRTKCPKCTTSCMLEIVTGKELIKYLKFFFFHHK
jgi:MoaA/NifB/PqqE/SkfB family radical SAM enzyme